MKTALQALMIEDLQTAIIDASKKEGGVYSVLWDGVSYEADTLGLLVVKAVTGHAKQRAAIRKRIFAR